MRFTWHFEHEKKAEIQDVIGRIQARGGGRTWKRSPDEIVLRRQLGGGKSACEVFEAQVKWDRERTAQVIKIGPWHEVRDEYQNWRTHLADGPAVFTPVQAATPAVLGGDGPTDGRREAIVYAHAGEHAGRPDAELLTFEELVQAAISGDRPIDSATAPLEQVFRAAQALLYGTFARQDSADLRTLEGRLGMALEVEVDGRCQETDGLAFGRPGSAERGRCTTYPDTVRDAANAWDQDAEGLQPGDCVHLHDMTVAWWSGDTLVARPERNPHLRVAIQAAGERRLRQDAEHLSEGAAFQVHGRVLSLRSTRHRAALVETLGGRFEWDDGCLVGPGARVADPFRLLPAVLDDPRPRLLARIHGDLNPRNILVTDGEPRLIDYAFTGDGEPLLADFARLEGLVSAWALPDDLTWTHHVRLQRLLAIVSHLGESAITPLAERLSRVRADLGRAFQVLAAAHPSDHPDVVPVAAG